MEVLQVISQLSNKESDCPARINKSELLYDSANVRVLLMIRLDGPGEADRVFLDICCFDNRLNKLAVMEKIPYAHGGMFVELPSLMTASVMVIVRKLESGSGVWESTTAFPQTESGVIAVGNSFETEEASKTSSITDDNSEERDVSEQTDTGVSDDTVEFDSAAVADIADFERAEPVRLTRAERRKKRREKAEAEEELRQFIKTDPHERRKRIIGRLITFVIIAGLCVGGFYLLQYKTAADTAYNKGTNLYKSGRFAEAIPELEAASGYIMTADKANEADWCLAVAYCRERNFFPAAVIFKNMDSYKESDYNYRSIIHAFSGIAAAGGNHTLLLSADGSITAAGSNDKEQCDTDSLANIIRVAAGENHSLALTRDNEVRALGDNKYEQCDVEKWDDIISVACGTNHSIGVENTGRVAATGDNSYGQCETDGWSGIVSASAGAEHTVGLRIDGTVAACGNNATGACNVGEWFDMAAVSAGNGFTVGINTDGELFFAGDKESPIREARKIKNAVAVSAGANHLLVLQEDGKVAAFGSNDNNQCSTTLWNNVVAVSAGARHSIAVCADGSVLCAGNNSDGQTSLDGVRNIGLPKSTVSIRKDVTSE